MKSSFTIERTIRAPITEVFEAFTDHRGYAEKPRRFAYKAVSGLPVSEHLAEVVLEESGGNTHMRYTVGHTAAIPGGEVVVGPVLKQAVGALIRGIAKSVE